MNTRPRIGDLVLLVYRECRCGEWCATGEGARAPRCPECGNPMWPLGTSVEDGVPRFGLSIKEQRKARGLGFVSFFTNEIAGSSLLNRARGLLGLTQAAELTYRQKPPGPYAADGEVSRDEN